MWGRSWFSPDTPFYFTNNTERHDITEILLKVKLNTITLTPNLMWVYRGILLIEI
jgi:hypothetical protein